jgi:hypothetical protein
MNPREVPAPEGAMPRNELTGDALALGLQQAASAANRSELAASKLESALILRLSETLAHADASARRAEDAAKRSEQHAGSASDAAKALEKLPSTEQLLALALARAQAAPPAAPPGEEGSSSKEGWFTLAKIPLTFVCLVLSLVVANALGFTKLKADVPGVGEFELDKQKEVARSTIEGELSHARLRTLPSRGLAAPVISEQQAIKLETVSDNTASLVKATEGSRQVLLLNQREGYIWIGNKRRDAWSSVHVETVEGEEVALDSIQTGQLLKVVGNMVLRGQMPPDTEAYYRSVEHIGVLPRGTTVRALAPPEARDREFAVQYWLKVEVHGDVHTKK